MREIKTGDRVKFVNENLVGVVTSLNGAMAGVTVEGDFEIPVAVSQLVKVTDPQQRQTEVAQAPVTTEIKNHGLYVAFDRISDTQLELLFYNNTGGEVLFTFFEKAKDGIKGKKWGTILFGEHAKLGRYNLEKFSEWPEFLFQALQVTTGVGDVVAPLNRSIRFSAKEFHGSFKQAFFLNRQAYLFKIDQPFVLPDIKRLQQRDFTDVAPAPIPLSRKPDGVIDLHIEKIAADAAILSPADIVAKQMEVFTKALEAAHVHKMPSIIFIHGVGNQFLKNKIVSYLRSQTALVKSFGDADMIRYGGGATEVVLTR